MLVHGSRLSHTQWAPQIPLLSKDFDVVSPDLPGHGARAGEGFSLERAIGAVAGAVESGDPGARVVLVGHSLGGYMAMAYAECFPQRLDGLVLVGSGAVPTGPGAAAYRLVAQVTERLGPDRMTRVNDRVLRRLYAPAIVDEVIAGGYFFDATPAAWGEVMDRCRPSMLREVTCPVLIAGGQFDQLSLQSRRFATAAPDGRTVRIARAGHLVGFDQPAALAEVIAGFAGAVGAPAAAGVDSPEATTRVRRGQPGSRPSPSAMGMAASSRRV
ncbi:MAG: alpha/beta hydrolase [Lapillicoccus sp.]